MAKYRAMKIDRSGWVEGDEIVVKNLFQICLVNHKPYGKDEANVIYSTIEKIEDDDTSNECGNSARSQLIVKQH